MENGFRLKSRADSTLFRAPRAHGDPLAKRLNRDSIRRQSMLP